MTEHLVLSLPELFYLQGVVVSHLRLVLTDTCKCKGLYTLYPSSLERSVVVIGNENNPIGEKLDNVETLFTGL